MAAQDLQVGLEPARDAKGEHQTPREAGNETDEEASPAQVRDQVALHGDDAEEPGTGHDLEQDRVALAHALSLLRVGQVSVGSKQRSLRTGQGRSVPCVLARPVPASARDALVGVDGNDGGVAGRPTAGLAARTDSGGHGGDPFESAGASGLVDHHIRTKARSPHRASSSSSVAGVRRLQPNRGAHDRHAAVRPHLPMSVLAQGWASDNSAQTCRGQSGRSAGSRRTSMNP